MADAHGILQPTDENLRLAAEALKRGELVVIPTETVYGLACDVFDEAAVRQTFFAKGRPADNPLIAHAASAAEAFALATQAPDYARRLASQYWPGPLTLVLPKVARVPAIATGGLDTVAVRVPAHPVTLELLRLVETPLAAPSANLFMGLSPTRAEHVDRAIAEAAFCVIDGGPCRIGIESTVIDATGVVPKVLRPGVLLSDLVGSVDSAVRRSPGAYPRHYAPRSKVTLVHRLSDGATGLTFGERLEPTAVTMPSDPALYAALLYASIHDLDLLHPELIQIELPPETEVWRAVNDRLRKMAQPK